MQSKPETNAYELKWQANLDERVRLAEAIIVNAGALAREAFAQRAHLITLKGPQDYLSATDLAVETYLRQQITAAFPQDSVLGEEFGGEAGQTTWVIDPIDGTANFVRGIPHYCICMALVHQGRVALGLIYQPETNELFAARLGQGAFCNGQPIHVSATTDLTASSVELGWSKRVSNDRYLAALANLLEAGVNVRRAGSGALGLAWVAEGRSDAYAELQMNSWDCLAGMLMVQEAGGRLGSPLDEFDVEQGGLVLAANAALEPTLKAAMGLD